GVYLAVDLDVVVAGGTFPAAFAVQTAVLEVLPVQCLGWEIVIALDNDRVVTLGQHGAIPHRFHDSLSPRYRRGPQPSSFMILSRARLPNLCSSVPSVFLCASFLGHLVTTGTFPLQPMSSNSSFWLENS